jgi:murein DD-endopeptidase MepM/ murein hydrolase activator NlpD
LRSFILGLVAGIVFCVCCLAWWTIRSPANIPGPRAGAMREAAAVPVVPAEPSRSVPVPVPDVTDYARLQARQLAFPLEGGDRRTLRDNFEERRGSLRHEALDILAARGTPVVAVDDGVVSKLFTSVRGGLTVYQFDPAGDYCYYYAHLDRYAEGLVEGQPLRKGQRVGYVGTTGNAPPNTPHLHFTIFKLGPEKRWWEGVALNPFPLWATASAR